MKSSFSNPWVDAVLEQMWVYCQVTEVVAKCIDPALLSSEQRLNPLEFHGKRRSAASVAPASTMPRARCPYDEGNIS